MLLINLKLETTEYSKSIKKCFLHVQVQGSHHSKHQILTPYEQNIHIHQYKQLFSRLQYDKLETLITPRADVWIPTLSKMFQNIVL